MTASAVAAVAAAASLQLQPTRVVTSQGYCDISVPVYATVKGVRISYAQGRRSRGAKGKHVQLVSNGFFPERKNALGE